MKHQNYTIWVNSIDYIFVNTCPPTQSQPFHLDENISNTFSGDP